MDVQVVEKPYGFRMLTLSAPQAFISNNFGTNQAIAAEDKREAAFECCKGYLGGAWLTCQFSDITVFKISGGLSNLLYSYELPEYAKTTGNEPRKVLVRFYGKVNREKALESQILECVVMAVLSERQHGPGLYGLFPGGRMEEYIPARPLLVSELSHPNVSQCIAKKMAELHYMTLPMKKTPTVMWENIERWLQTLELEEEHGQHDKDLVEIINKLQKLDMRAELSWLKDFLEEEVTSPVVFCHNDLQEGNILLRTDKNEPVDLNNITPSDLVIIDFEYCSYNHRGFDIANHLNEFAFDYTNTSPPYFWERSKEQNASEEQKTAFVNAYMAEVSKSPNYVVKQEDSTMNILKEIEVYTLLSHYYWGLWSLVSSLGDLTKTIEFDYWKYGERRLQAYFAQKQKLTAGPN